jgi:hypothetical protein
LSVELSQRFIVRSLAIGEAQLAASHAIAAQLELGLRREQ